MTDRTIRESIGDTLIYLQVQVQAQVQVQVQVQSIL